MVARCGFSHRGYLLSDGSLRLLQYLAAHERPTVDPILRRWAFNDVVGCAAAKGDLETLQWLLESYLPDEFLTKERQRIGELIQKGVEETRYVRQIAATDRETLASRDTPGERLFPDFVVTKKDRVALVVIEAKSCDMEQDKHRTFATMEALRIVSKTEDTPAERIGNEFPQGILPIREKVYGMLLEL
ncbi:hypothetical protein BBJ28_00024377 [Nothophytophthora sp. Chile5]|nr:hypothetical protein BBJ28_00024377 [Nothophytophthora sp. Chile5]